MPSSASDRRWSVALVVGAAIAVSYLDRQTLPVAIAEIQKEIPITNTQFAQLGSAFLFAYAIMYAVGGRLMDLLGTRTGFTLIMVAWSLACAGHGFASNFATLAICRFLLGMGEGGGFPAATKVIAEWFPVRERSTAMGIINSGTAIGGIAAPPFIAAVIGAYGWRWVFFLTGITGIAWAAWWLATYSIPPALAEEKKEPAVPWLSLITNRNVMALVTAKFLSDAGWYFYLFWLPKYLYDVRGFDTKQVGYFAWIPFVAAGLGSLLGGWFSSRLIHQGRPLHLARRIAMGSAASMMPLMALVTQAPNSWVIVLFSIAYFGQQAYSTVLMILPTDLFPRRAVGAVAGLVGFGGAMGGVVFGQVVGWMLDHGTGYGPVFAIVSTFHVISFLILLLFIPKSAFAGADTR